MWKLTDRKWITYNKHTNTYARHSSSSSSSSEIYSHSQCQTEQILIYNYFYCHTEIHTTYQWWWLAVRSVRRSATWLTVFIFVSQRLVSFFFCLPVFTHLNVFSLVLPLQLNNFDGDRKKRVLILCECICPVGLVDKEMAQKKNHFYRVCWCQIN